MAYSEHQHRLLRAIGLRVWSQPATFDADMPAPTARAETTAVRDQAAAVRAGPTPPARAERAEAQSRSPSAAGASPGRTEGLAALDWAALREAVAQCRQCALCESRSQTVFGVGHPRAQWLVVGEAPGEQEDAAGEPFVGASGQLLDRMLAALQLTRSAEGELPHERRVYIANTLKCRPPRNRNPTPEEMQRCEPFLLRQIELLRPRIILAMGKFAIQMLLRTDAPVGRLRGQVHQYQGVPLVVTYHPAYLLRSLGEKARAWEDLCLAADTFEQAAREGVPA